MVKFEIFFASFLALLGLAASVLTTFYSDWVQAHTWTMYFGWFCLAAAICFLAMAVVQWKKAHATLTIHRALWYGDDPEKSDDKTHIVRGWIEDNMIHHRVHQDELGETPGRCLRSEAKKLEVLYSLRQSKKRIRVVTNGNMLILPEVFSSEEL